MKKIRERLSREAFNDHQMALNSGTQSDLFQCGRCHKRNTTYNQVGNVILLHEDLAAFSIVLTASHRHLYSKYSKRCHTPLRSIGVRRATCLLVLGYSADRYEPWFKNCPHIYMTVVSTIVQGGPKKPDQFWKDITPVYDDNSKRSIYQIFQFLIESKTGASNAPKLNILCTTRVKLYIHEKKKQVI